jgi:hypothetical protein
MKDPINNSYKTNPINNHPHWVGGGREVGEFRLNGCSGCLLMAILSIPAIILGLLIGLLF